MLLHLLLLPLLLNKIIIKTGMTVVIIMIIKKTHYRRSGSILWGTQTPCLKLLNLLLVHSGVQKGGQPVERMHFFSIQTMNLNLLIEIRPAE